MSSSKDQEAKDEELLVLSSIFDNNVLAITPGKYSGTFTVVVQLKPGFKVVIRSRARAQGQPSDNGVMAYHDVSYLSPITLHFNLPYGYPSRNPPRYHLACCWLSLEQLSQLCQKLDNIWRENCGEVILFHWLQFLQDESLSLLAISDVLDLNLAFPHLQNAPRNVVLQACKQNPKSTQKPAFNTRRHLRFIYAKGKMHRTSYSVEDSLFKILEYNKKCNSAAFDNTVFMCEVCMNKHLGSNCTCFEECRHIFCKECVKNFFEGLIRDGQVNLLSCLANGCTTAAASRLIQENVSKECFERYDKLMLTSALDSMGDIVYCARNQCASPVIKEPDGGVAICPACKFAFCVYCRMSSHGIEDCQFKKGEDQKLFEQYSTGTDATKQDLERRYGKRQISKLVERTLAKNWMTENTKSCPQCKAPIEKQSGCNKMVCWRCQLCFCWICLEALRDKNPYRHFNATGSSCFGQLFQGAEFDSDDEDENDVGEIEDEDFDDDEDDEQFWDMVVGALADAIQPRLNLNF